jgi:hypothetical protein
MPKRAVGHGNPNHDKLGKFTTASGGGKAKTATKRTPPPIKRTTAAERAEPRKPSKVVEQAQENIDSMVRKYGTYGMNTRKPVPTGKTVLLMHRTSPEAAEKILTEGVQASQKPNLTAAEQTERRENLFGVVPSDVKNWEGYGEAIIGVKVPRKDVERDESMKGFNPAPIKVPVKKLAGRKVKRYK